MWLIGLHFSAAIASGSAIMAREKRPVRACLSPRPRKRRAPATASNATPSNRSLTQPPLQEEDFVRRPSVRIIIPEPLKSILVDDWEKVTKEHRLVPLPSQKPVTKFLNEYYEHESINRRPGSPDADILEEVIAGLKEYFNKALGRLLLYRFERQQYYTLFKQIDAGHGEHAGETLADVYGCEHLLRLFSKYHRHQHHLRDTRLTT